MKKRERERITRHQVQRDTVKDIPNTQHKKERKTARMPEQ